MPLVFQPALPSRSMRLIILVLLSMMVPLDAFAQNQVTFDTRDYRWKNRLLLTFAKSPDEEPAKSLRTAIDQHKVAFMERDLVLISVYDEGISRANTLPLDPGSISKLRSQYDMPPGSDGVILVGKDGGVKLKQSDPADLDEIYALIDTMPMRRQEIKSQRTNNNFFD